MLLLAKLDGKGYYPGPGDLSFVALGIAAPKVLSYLPNPNENPLFND
jgi:hypothetical protein